MSRHQAVPVLRSVQPVLRAPSPGHVTARPHQVLASMQSAGAVSGFTSVFSLFGGWVSAAGGSSPLPGTSSSSGSAGAILLLLALLGLFAWRRLVLLAPRRPSEYVLGHLVSPG